MTPLPPGYQIITEYEDTCDYDFYKTGNQDRAYGCGGTFYRRISISPSGMVHNERTACNCILEYRAKNAGQEAQLRDERQLHHMLHKIERYFKPWNLLDDETYNKMTFENFKPTTQTHRAALSYLQAWTPHKGSICLAGKQGRGKTHLALAAAKKAEHMQFSSLAIRSIDLLNRLRRCYNSKDENLEIEIMQILKNVDVLVIDDIGTERPTGWVLEKLYDLIDYRHQRKGTIFTTNMQGDQMEHKLGGALTSRIYARNDTSQLFVIDGQDWRVKSDPWGQIATAPNFGVSR